jgi:protein-S-isoprenylcysteine O-methyltransferase Ste14
MTTAQIILLCWGLVIAVWGVGWLYNIFFGPKVVEGRRDILNAPFRWLVLAALAILLRRLWPGDFSFPITFQSPWLWTVGLVFLLASTLFVLWARLVLGRLWASTAMIKQDHELRTEGPYRVTRHPIYTGLLGMAFGTMLMNGFGPFLPLLFVLIVFFELKIHTEEALLIKTFGEQYIEYKRRVPQLVPGLTPNRAK